MFSIIHLSIFFFLLLNVLLKYISQCITWYAGTDAVGGYWYAVGGSLFHKTNVGFLTQRFVRPPSAKAKTTGDWPWLCSPLMYPSLHSCVLMNQTAPHGIFSFLPLYVKACHLLSPVVYNSTPGKPGMTIPILAMNGSTSTDWDLTGHGDVKACYTHAFPLPPTQLSKWLPFH